MKYIVFISLFFFSSGVLSEEPIHTGVQGKSFTARQLSVELSSINDVGFIIVIDPSGKATIAGSAQLTMGVAGGLDLDLVPYLKQSTNLLIFALWNKAGKNLDLKYWDKTFLSGYGYKYRLIADGTTLYNLEGSEKGNAGIAYWNAFVVHNNSESLTIEPIPRHIQDQIAQVFDEVNRDTTLTTINQKPVNLGANIATALMQKL